MPLRLPPLHDLVAFEAAARVMSFLKAAEELHVTQSAASHRIKALEEFLGMPLPAVTLFTARLRSQASTRAPGAPSARMRPPWRSTIRWLKAGPMPARCRRP